MYSVHSIFSVRDFGFPILPRVGWLSLRTRYSFIVVSALIREIRHSGRSVCRTECDAVARNMGLNVADCAIVVSLKRGLLPASLISRAVVPIRPAEPVPAIQVRRASIRPIPEITAHPISPLRGENIDRKFLPGVIPSWGFAPIHPQKTWKINRPRRRTKATSRASPSNPSKKSQHATHSRDNRAVDIRGFQFDQKRRSIGRPYPAWRNRHKQ